MKKYLRNIVGAIVKREEHEKNEDKIKSLKKGMLRLSTVQNTQKERAFEKVKKNLYEEYRGKKAIQKNT